MTGAVEWTGGVLHTRQVYGDRTGVLDAVAVVLAQGRAAAPVPGHAPASAAAYVIGDALAPRRLTHAMLEGTRFGAAL